MTTVPDPASPDALSDALLVDVGADHLERLHADLVARAGAPGELDVAYRVVDSPVGRLLLAATDVGLVRVAFEAEDHDAVLAALSVRVGPRVLLAPRRLDATARELDEYFAGRRRAFDLPLDRRLSGGYRGAVLEVLSTIPYGRTESYASVARTTGNPGAVRAVGTACATNPIPVVVPCHRVVRSDGTWGRYLGGARAKSALLRLEGAA